MPQGQVITESRPCPGCEYDLKGLRIGGHCPECGQLIRAKRKSYGPREGTMTDAPPAYVKRVGLGFTLMSVGIALTLLGVPLSCFVRHALLVTTLLGSLAWIAGVVIVSMPRPPEFAEQQNPILDTPKWRTGVRTAAAMWPLFLTCAILAVLTQTAGMLGTMFLIATGLAGVASFVGLIPISIYVAEMEFWMSDDTGGWQLRGAAWLILVFGILFLITTVAVPFLAFWCALVLVVATIILGWHIVGCASQTRWVLRYQEQNAGRAERITERLRDRSERGGTVAGATPCLECGYDLRGLPFGGHCPECGASYADRTPFPVLPTRKKNEAPIEIDQSGPVQTIRPAVQHIGKPPPPKDDSPIPLDGDEDLPEDLQDPPPRPAAPPPSNPPRRPETPDDDGPIPLADDDRP